jgi:uncharacterized protein
MGRRVDGFVGLISDTHDLVRPEALAALQGATRIVHAGDVCTPDVLDALARIAPVIAVRGNNDVGAWAKRLRAVERFDVDGVVVVVKHDAKTVRPADVAGARVLIVGHSHQPSVAERDGLLIVNPGSAGPRRFRLPIAIGKLVVQQGHPRAEITTLS